MLHDHTPVSGVRTNVRFSLGRAAFAAASRLAPSAAAVVAERLFFSPGRPRRSRGEEALSSGEPLVLRVEGRHVAAWRWGDGPTVVLLHGWGGRAAQLTSFVGPLVDRGFSVLALDAPGHGRSRRGLSSAPQFARALRAAAHAVGGVSAVVAHSLGAAATALAIGDGLAVDRVVFLAPPANPAAWVAPFAARLGIPPHVVTRMRRRSERRLGLRWADLDVPRLAADRTVPLLVIHDREDAEVPLRDGAAIASAWPGARLFETSGLGHKRLLRDPRVVTRTVDFLAAGAGTRCSTCGRLATPARPCERCRLEGELFDRERRWSAAAGGSAS
jgi:pimeloyl-ACP methyl ester carboxylesterase